MQPATPCNTMASQQCTQFWVLPALVLLALCTPLASAAREWAAQTWSEHLPRICTTVLLYHAARNWASSLARCIPTLASTQAARRGLSPTSHCNGRTGTCRKRWRASHNATPYGLRAIYVTCGGRGRTWLLRLQTGSHGSDWFTDSGKLQLQIALDLLHRNSPHLK